MVPLNQQESTTTMQIPLLDVSRSNSPIQQEILDAISSVADSGRFVGGEVCHKFEKEIAAYCTTEFAIGCASGSDALILALMAIGIQPGDEVIVPSFTFFATISAITRLGATPVFVDIEPGTFNINPELIESKITRRTKAVIPVHLFGQCADMQRINEIAVAHQLYVVEDAAQSIGSQFAGCAAGGMSHVGCFSFYPTKNLGGFGDGGMLTTSDPDLAARLRLLANHGMQPRYHHQIVGINSRLDAVQAAVLSVKLQYLDEYNSHRAQNAKTYKRLISAAGLQHSIILPLQRQRCHHVWNQFTLRIVGGSRDELRNMLDQRGVKTEIYYPIPMHLQPCFAHLNYGIGSLPETERAAKEVLSLPIFPELSEQEINYVVSTLTDLLLGQQPYRLAG